MNSPDVSVAVEPLLLQLTLPLEAKLLVTVQASAVAGSVPDDTSPAVPPTRVTVADAVEPEEPKNDVTFRPAARQPCGTVSTELGKIVPDPPVALENPLGRPKLRLLKESELNWMFAE
jgi:hypothetical protein